jgi:hypothetical protein
MRPHAGMRNHTHSAQRGSENNEFVDAIFWAVYAAQYAVLQNRTIAALFWCRYAIFCLRYVGQALMFLEADSRFACRRLFFAIASSQPQPERIQ